MTPQNHSILQKLFNTAFAGLHGQGFEKSVDVKTRGGLKIPPKSAGYVCRYRSNTGIKCAIGHCIPDEKYSPIFEGNRAGDDFIMSLLGVPDPMAGVMDELQECHDQADGPDMMKICLIEFAERYDLQVPKL